MSTHRWFKVIACLLTISLLLPSAASAAEPAVGQEGRTVILTAFTFQDEAGTWLGETGPFLNRLDNPQDVSAELPFCDVAFEGQLYGQLVVAVAMGVGKVHATSCMMDLLHHYGGEIKDVIWSGIAGGTPMVGGMLDTDGNFRDGTPTAIGDVCIAYAARDWDLQYSSVADGMWWEGSFPNENTTAVGSQALADELYAASLQVRWPDVPEGPAANIAKYHGPDGVRRAQAWYGNCAEVTGDNFWHGVPEDARARALVADLLNQVVGGDPGAEDVFAITAMENTGWMNVLEKYAAAGGREIPFAYARSFSNYDHPWLGGDGTPAILSQESINAGMSEGGGVPYGSLTAALPVLKLLELRAVATGGKLDTTPRVAVMSAFAPELAALQAETTIEASYVINGRTFTLGTLRGVKVVEFLSGVSMVNAAMTTQLALDHFHVTHVVFSGIAGGVNPNLHIGDVVIPAQWAQYQEMHYAREMPDGGWMVPDWRQSDLPGLANFDMGFPKYVEVTRKGSQPDAGENRLWFQVDPAMLAVAEEAAGAVDLEECAAADACLEQPPTLKVGGNGVSGMTFVDNAAFRQWAWEVWEADALDMESSAVAHVAYANDVPFLVVRSLSDLAGGGPGENEIGIFLRLAADNSAQVLLAFLDAWAEQMQP